jgi:type II secretory pathway pseudopilin PulG
MLRIIQRQRRGAWPYARTLRIIRGHREQDEAGVSLLEVLMAISLLGISFASIFSGLSADLRTTDRLDLIERANDYAAGRLRELMLDPSLGAGEERSGGSPLGMEWTARTRLVEARPLSDPKKPAQLVRIILEVSWRTRSGREGLSLETLKLCIPQPPPSP